MNDILSENVRDLSSHVTGNGKAIGERLQSAAAATAAAAGQAQKMVQDASEVAEDVFDAGLRASRSVSRQMHENPLIAVLVGIALGCAASLWFRAGRSTATAPSPKKSRASTPPKKAVSG